METFKTVHGVPTKVIACGKHIDEDLSDVNFLILLIPGNPGVVDYYREFMIELHRRVLEKYPDTLIPVWGISHAGHQKDDLKKQVFPSFEGNEHLYNLEGQFNHKFEFIKTYVPNHIKVIGIGHSIGCKAWSEVIKMIDVTKNNTENEKRVCLPHVAKCFMLFPTLERMRDSPNGKRFTRLIPYYPFIEPFLKLIMMLPTVIHQRLLKVFLGRNVPETVQKASLNLFIPDICHNVFHMAKCEMEQVWDLDAETLSRNIDKIFFYFGTADDWVPLEYVDDMKNMFPGMNFQVCDKGVEHAFVIKHNVAMAETICSLIDLKAL